jgi:hypothetical protein
MIAEATMESGEPVGWAIGQNTVWYRFTPSARAVVRAQVQGMGYYVLNAYRADGSGMSGLTYLTGYISAPIVFDVQAGSTYYIQAGNFGPVPVQWWETFTFGLEIVPPPANDNFAGAIPITTLPFRDTVDMTGATTESGEPSALCGGNFPRTVWYSFRPTASGTYSASNFADRILGGVNVFTGTTLESLTHVACGANGGSGAFHAEAGTTYYLQTGTWYSSGSLGTQLEATPPPAVGMLWGPIPTTRLDVVTFQGLFLDPIGIDSWTWTFGDGGTATGQYPQHQYAQDGDYDVTVTVTTPDGRTNSATEVVRVRTPDTTPPVIDVLDKSGGYDFYYNATSPDGALVEYTATVTDDTDKSPALVCQPLSGTVWPIGITTLGCTATDASGNTASVGMDVWVLSAADQLYFLHDRAAESGGPGTSLADKVGKAQASLDAGDVAGTYSILKAFINEVRAQAGDKIPQATATTLIADATRITKVLGY